MAKFGDIKMVIDPYFTETRVTLCRNTGCKFNLFDKYGDGAECSLKKIFIGGDGKCAAYEPRKEDKK